MSAGLEIDGDLLLRLEAHPPARVSAREQTLVVDLPDWGTARALLRCRHALPFDRLPRALDKVLALTGWTVEARIRGTQVGSLDGSSPGLLGRMLGVPGLRLRPVRVLLALCRPRT